MKPRVLAPLPLLAALGLLLGLVASGFCAPGCPLREWTGFKCPGCGANRSLEAWLAGNPEEAVYWNALLLPGLLLLAAAGVRKPWKEPGWLALAGLALGFGILRNLPFYLLY